MRRRVVWRGRGVEGQEERKEGGFQTGSDDSTTAMAAASQQQNGNILPRMALAAAINSN